MAAHLQAAGLPARVVCFTCGHAARALRQVGLDVLAIGPGQDLEPADWWSPARIAATWPDRYDATSGHLPLPMVARLGLALRDHLGDLRGRYAVPTGSGETLTALRLAYPALRLRALVNMGVGTQHDPRAPLAPVLGPLLDASDPRTHLGG